MAGRLCGEPLGVGAVRPAQLRVVAVRLLEVVAGDLVGGRPAVIPGEKPPHVGNVEVCPAALGQELVRGVADQDVAESVARLVRELGAAGLDQLALDEPVQRRVHLVTAARQRPHRAAVEPAPLDRRGIQGRRSAAR